MNTLFRIGLKLATEPLALRMETADVLIKSLLLHEQEPQALLEKMRDADDTEILYTVKQGIAIIPVRGVLISEATWYSEFFGMAGYDQIGAMFNDAMKNDEVRAVALHVDSPGGACSGLFDLVDMIRAARENKPIWAIIDDCATSAAYALASAADYVTCPRAGTVGSIGVIAVYPDISAALEKNGVTFNTLTFGEAKADGAPFAPMSKKSRERLQAVIDGLGEIFVQSVAEARALPPQKVRDLQAGVMLGADGLAAGLVDAILSPDEAFGRLILDLKS
jgi:signal peptide peptidase SppA